MADVQSNIKVSIDTTDALASIKNLQRQISAFHTSMAKSGAAANAVTAGMQQNLLNSINATGKFSAQMKTIRTTTESFTNSLEKNKFTLGEYFRYAGGASKTFGKLFKTEFDTINKVARENVKDLQTQYIKMGRDANGAMKAIAVRPLSLDMNDLATKTMIASERQALLNQLLKQGSTNLLNFGKNTQWAGRQLMVGFTIPLMAVGSAAAKTFMDMETQAIRFRKVYGDLFTPASETKAALDGITELGKQFTRYGVAVSSTVGLAAEAAAAGFKGLDLQRQTAAATKLSILGQVESQKALETTIALQNAFSMSSEDLATNIDFLNAVENQTVLSLDDMSTAIPKAAPVIQQLGGDVKDLAFFMTAMKEGGINASEGANALKSGLASMINPTGKAAAMLEGFGINIKNIVVDNKGDLKKTVVDFATALNQLDPLNRAQAIEQMFGKFQFARLSTLFANVTKEGTQAARVLDLAGSSVQDLASLSEKELGMTSESAMNKFKASVENLKLSLVPVGEEFLKAVTPIAEFVTKILDKFNNLGDGTKKIIVTLTAVIAGLGPVLLMTFGLLANGVANIIKGFVAVKSIFNKTGQSSATLGTEVKYMTLEQRNAAAVAASLDQVHRNLAQTFTSEASAVDALTRAYQRSIAAQSSFIPTGVPIGRGPIKKRAKGKPSVVGGTGNKDTELSLLTPGETVIPADMSKKYGFLINGMIADNIPGYIKGKKRKGISERTADVPVFGDLSIFIQDRAENQSQGASAPGLEQVLAPLVARVGEARGLGFSQQTQAQYYPGIIEEYKPVVQTFVDNLKTEMDRTATTITSESERLGRAWQVAGKSVEAELQKIPNEVERGTVRQALGVEADSYGSVAGDFRSKHGWGGRTARHAPGRVPASYVDPNYRKGTSAAYEMMTGKKVDTSTQDYGHVFDIRTRKKLGLPTTIPLEELRADPSTNPSTISTINNSILREEEKAARSRTVGQAATTTEEAVKAVRKTAKTASPSKRTIPVGEDIARGLSEGMKKETPRVVSEANKMTDAAVKGTRTRRSASRPQGAPSTPVVPGKRVRRSSSRSGGTVGPNGQILPGFISTPDNANMLPIVSKPGPQSRVSRMRGMATNVGSKFAGKTAGLGMAGSAAMMAGSFLPGKAGQLAQQAMPVAFGLQALQMALKLPIPHLKAVALGAAGIYGMFKLINSLKEKERLAIEGLGDAATVSEKKLKTLGDFFGIVPTKIDFLSRDAATTTGATPQQQAQIDTLQKDKNFQKDFKNDITSLKKGTDAQAKLVFDSIAIQLRGSGFAKEQIDLIIKALQEESGKTDIKFDFANIDLSTDKGMLNFDKNFGAILKDLDAGITQVYDSMMYRDNKLNKWVGGVVTKTSEDATVNLKLAADAANGFINGLRAQLENGTISADQFAQGFARIRSSIATMPKPEQMILLNEMMKTLPKNLQKAASGITGTGNKLLIMEAQALGLTGALAGAIDAMGILESAVVFGPDDAIKRYKASNFLKEFEKTIAARRNSFAKLAKANIPSTNPYVDPDTGSTGKGLTDEEKYLKILEKQINALEAKRDAQKKINDEIQREIDLVNKLEDLSSQAVNAKISGNYIQAAMLGQQSVQAQAEFDRQTYLNTQQEPIDKLMARKQEIQDGSKLTKAEKAKLPKKANGGLIKGPGTGRSDSIKATMGYAGGGSIRVSNGEFIVKAASVRDYGLNAMNSVNNGTANIDTNSGGTVYNINMPITSNASDPKVVGDYVIRQLKVELDKNNKSNRINI